MLHCSHSNITFGRYQHTKTLPDPTNKPSVVSLVPVIMTHGFSRPDTPAVASQPSFSLQTRCNEDTRQLVTEASALANRQPKGKYVLNEDKSVTLFIDPTLPTLVKQRLEKDMMTQSQHHLDTAATEALPNVLGNNIRRINWPGLIRLPFVAARQALLQLRQASWSV